jgi:hypothetical protein
VRLPDFLIALIHVLIARLRISEFKDSILEFLRQIEDSECIGLGNCRRGFSYVNVK